jgi:sec-independent protein translocase protein TatA
VIGDILQPTHLLFILVIALLVLGPKRLPEVGRSLGRGLRDFRHAMSGEDPHDEVLSQGIAEEEPANAASEPAQPATDAAEPASEPAEHVGAGADRQP